MVWPVLGLMAAAGLGTLAYGQSSFIPRMKERQQDRAGERFRGLLAANPDAGPDEQARMLAGGGLLSPEAFVSMGSREYLARQRADLADRNSARASGRAAGNAAAASARGDRQWYERQQWLRDNPTASEELANQRFGLEQDAFQFEKDQAIRDSNDIILQAQETYIQEALPIMNKTQVVNHAIQNIDNLSFDRRAYDTPEGRQATDTVNRIIGAMESDYWLNEKGRTDAPSQIEAEQLAEMFPRVDNKWLTDNQRRQTVLSNLRRYRQSLLNDLERRNGALQRAGIPVPQMGAQNVLPEGWEPAQ